MAGYRKAREELSKKLHDLSQYVAIADDARLKGKKFQDLLERTMHDLRDLQAKPKSEKKSKKKDEE